MRNLDAIIFMDLSCNKITRNIPSIIGFFQILSGLNLSKNSFQGDIPKSFESLKGLDLLDLLNNNLSSAIPKSLEALPYLKYLNLSYNKLSKEIPFSGVFLNFTTKSFLGNEELCGNPIFGVPPCTSPISSQQSRVKQLLLRYIVHAITSIIIFTALVTMLRRHPKCKI